jgi:ATP-dependent helicase HrpB
MAFPDRVARKRKIPEDSSRGRSGTFELVFSSGGSARIEDSAFLREAEDFVTLEIQELKALGQVRSQLKVRSVVAIEPQWLFDIEPVGVTEEEEIVWDKEREKVVAVTRMKYDAITLTESRGEARDRRAAASLLLKSGLGVTSENIDALSAVDFVEALGRVGDKYEIEASIARPLLMARYREPLKLPELTWERLRSGLGSLLSQAADLATLRRLNWAEEIRQQLPPPYSSILDSLAPLSLLLPSGRRAKIHYPLDKGPWLESRLQDFFGMKRGPAVLGERIPLTLHLLAPNHRAVQVTSDLKGFWERAYPSIRKELGRKYPRHAWPENPLVAVPAKRSKS